ncbi:unnamed protein product, partial [Ixodes pacificus]
LGDRQHFCWGQKRALSLFSFWFRGELSLLLPLSRVGDKRDIPIGVWAGLGMRESRPHSPGSGKDGTPGAGEKASPRVRTTLLLLLGTCVGLPLGLLRNLDSLTSFSAMSLVFYALLVLKIFGEAFPVLWSMTWWDKVVLWRHENLLSVLPIFAMALSCQP